MHLYGTTQLSLWKLRFDRTRWSKLREETFWRQRLSVLNKCAGECAEWCDEVDKRANDIECWAKWTLDSTPPLTPEPLTSQRVSYCTHTHLKQDSCKTVWALNICRFAELRSTNTSVHGFMMCSILYNRHGCMRICLNAVNFMHIDT